MDRRLTAEAERVVKLAQSEALRLGYSYVGTEHLLLGILASGEGLAWHALKPHGIEQLQREVVRTCPPDSPPFRGELGFSPRAQRVISDLAYQEAGGQAGTEHLLLAIIGLTDCVAVGVLQNVRVNLTALRGTLRRN